MSLRGVDWENGVIELNAIYSKFNNELTEEARAALNLLKNEMAEKSTSMYVEKKHEIKYEGVNSYIDDILIPDAILEEKEFSIVERSDEIENIEQMLCEAKQANRSSDAWMMEKDLEELRILRDEYVFSSMATNEYISYSGTPGSFNEKCEEILNEVKENG